MSEVFYRVKDFNKDSVKNIDANGKRKETKRDSSKNSHKSRSGDLCYDYQIVLSPEDLRDIIRAFGESKASAAVAGKTLADELQPLRNLLSAAEFVANHKQFRETRNHAKIKCISPKSSISTHL